MGFFDILWLMNYSFDFYDDWFYFLIVLIFENLNIYLVWDW